MLEAGGNDVLGTGEALDVLDGTVAGAEELQLESSQVSRALNGQVLRVLSRPHDEVGREELLLLVPRLDIVTNRLKLRSIEVLA